MEEFRTDGEIGPLASVIQSLLPRLEPALLLPDQMLDESFKNRSMVDCAAAEARGNRIVTVVPPVGGQSMWMVP